MDPGGPGVDPGGPWTRGRQQLDGEAEDLRGGPDGGRTRGWGPETEAHSTRMDQEPRLETRELPGWTSG